jgi:hypothetical protein
MRLLPSYYPYSNLSELIWAAFRNCVAEKSVYVELTGKIFLFSQRKTGNVRAIMCDIL